MPRDTATNGKQYWRSLDDLADTPEFQEFVYREFPAGATDVLTSSERRQFLKIMAASAAFAGFGMTGCRRWPEEKIAPYAIRPPGHAPGSTDQFATCMDRGGIASGLLVTSYDHRPIKIEGNPLHPMNQGATDAITQATILDLYDPDRSRSVIHDGKTSDYAKFTKWARSHFGALKAQGGAGLAFLSESNSSPSVAEMKGRLANEFPSATWHEYEPINHDNEREGTVAAFGSPQRVHYSFDKAKTIVSLDSDFLGCDSQSVKWTRDFAAGRRLPQSKESGFKNASINRLYAFESGVSLTGANADHRVALRSTDIAIIAAKIADALIQEAPADLATLASRPIQASIPQSEIENILGHILHDLDAHHGECIVTAGPRQPAEVHLLVHMINSALGNVGKTISYTPQPELVNHAESIRVLLDEAKAGSVNALVIIGGNPAYNAPADLEFANALSNIDTTIHLSDYVDETSLNCTWHINRAHYLESWGDGRAYDGTYCPQQPLILPLFNGKSAVELLATIAGDDSADGYAIVRHTFSQTHGMGNFEATWRKALHDGVVRGSAVTAALTPITGGRNLDSHVASLLNRWSAPKNGALEIVFTPDAKVYDGRYANNGWLQELPDPITKLTWDNAAIISPETAKQLSLKTGRMVTVSVNNRSLELPVFVLPGQHAGSVTVSLGYGRGMPGRICSGAGFDLYQLRPSTAMGYATGTIEGTGGKYTLASTQDHHAMDTVGGKGTQDRIPTLFREASLDEYRDDPKFAKHRTHVVHRLSLFEEDFPFQSEEGRPTAKYAWAMSIDLNACTGCGACITACQAENNIPIVGKDQVKRGRELHWIRVDRYFKGGTENMPNAFSVAPVPCMHCENAPCEQVCPVAATVHDSDGLNVMVYNRCVGTRYCSNNCPYKVRRFNYYDYHRRDPHRENPGPLIQVDPDYFRKGQAKADPIKQMQFNPEVTVRSRGVMEKCTYCVQRITTAKIDAKNEWVRKNPSDRSGRVAPIPDGTVTTACAQACPAQAIVFGDLEDPNSKVSKLHKHERTYEMLEEINTKPRTRFMAKVRNPAFGGHSNGDGGHG